MSTIEEKRAVMALLEDDEPRKPPKRPPKARQERVPVYRSQTFGGGRPAARAVPMPTMGVTYLTVDEYCKLMRVGRSAVQGPLLAGLIEGAVKVGGSWRIPAKREEV